MEAERHIEFTQDSPGGLLRQRVMAQGLTDAQLRYVALAFDPGNPARTTTPTAGSTTLAQRRVAAAVAGD